jgi:hypothetical protein
LINEGLVIEGFRWLVYLELTPWMECAGHVVIEQDVGVQSRTRAFLLLLYELLERSP